MNLRPSNGKRQPSRRSNGVDSGSLLQSSALPPVLFTLPDLGADPRDENKPAEPVAESCGDEPSASAMCASQAAVEETTDQGDAAVNDAEADISRQTNEPIDFEPVPAPAEPVSETEPQQPKIDQPVRANDESLIDIWGTRAVVVTLLLLVVSSAVVAARKVPNGSNQVTADESVSQEEAIAELAVSDGVPETQSTTLADNDANSASVAAATIVDHIDNSAAKLGATATLRAPQTDNAIDYADAVAASDESMSTPAVPTDDANTLLNPSESIAASTASSRSQDLLPGDTTSATESPADSVTLDPLAAPTADQNDLPAGPTIELPANAVNTDPPAAGAVVQNTLAQASPATTEIQDNSEAVRFSATPTGISDWSRYFPAITPAPPGPATPAQPTP